MKYLWKKTASTDTTHEIQWKKAAQTMKIPMPAYFVRKTNHIETTVYTENGMPNMKCIIVNI